MIKKLAIGLLVLIVAFLSVLLFRPSLIVPRAQAIAELRQEGSQFYIWRGAKIHYVEEGEGPTILMIHGFGGSHRNFQKIAQAMKSNYRIIRVDVPGFGLSEMPQNQEDALSTLRTFLSDFIKDKQLHDLYVMGVSMGGGLAWITTRDNPSKVKGLILLDAAGYDLQKAKKGAVRFARFGFAPFLFQKGIPLLFSKRAFKRVLFDDSLVDLEEVKRANKIWNTEGNLTTFFDVAHSTAYPKEEWIKEIKTPSLIIWGKQDEILPVKYAANFKRDLTNSTLKIYDQCGHAPMNEKMEQTKTDIEAFILATTL